MANREGRAPVGFEPSRVRVMHAVRGVPKSQTHWQGIVNCDKQRRLIRAIQSRHNLQPLPDAVAYCGTKTQ